MQKLLLAIPVMFFTQFLLISSATAQGATEKKYYIISAYNSKILAPSAQDYAGIRPLVLTADGFNPTLQWKFNIANDMRTIENISSKKMWSADTTKGFLKSGASVFIADENKGRPQLWKMLKNPDGNHVFRSLAANKDQNVFLTVTDDGSGVVLSKSPDNILKMEWILKVVDQVPAPVVINQPVSIPVVLPVRTQFHKWDYTQINNSQVRQIYFTVDQYEGMIIESRDPNYRPPARVPVYNFMTTEGRQLFYSASKGSNANSVPLVFELRTPTVMGEPTLYLIGGVYDNDLYGVSYEGRLIKAPVKVNGNVPAPFEFTILYKNDNNEYKDILVTATNMFALTVAGKLNCYSFYDRKWTVEPVAGLHKIISVGNFIYGINKTNELIKYDFYGKKWEKVADDAMDLCTDANEKIVYFISSKTNLIMQYHVDAKRVIAEPIDPQGTFTRFISKNRLIAENGKRNIYWYF